ncbi:MAG: DNA alkylation repair protein [Leptospira sp.]|nr:DNA alkylation repair protein [Leptospira sp.]
MAKKLKDYYDLECAKLWAEKLLSVHKKFDSKGFIIFLKKNLEDNEFLGRQDVFVEAFEIHLGVDYSKNINTFSKLLGPKLDKSEGMFTEGWWLWPVGRYVEKHGLQNVPTSLDFIYELTQRFTGEFAIRPLISADPKKTMKIIEKWSRDKSVHVRRLSSEGLRTRLPWATKSFAALEEFALFKKILTNLKDDPDKFVQKSVGNNINDLFKDHPDKAWEIIREWESDHPSKHTLWIIKHGKRSLRKKEDKKIIGRSK